MAGIGSILIKRDPIPNPQIIPEYDTNFVLLSITESGQEHRLLFGGIFYRLYDRSLLLKKDK